MRRSLVVLIALASCGGSFETQSIVIDLRVLGIQAEPPEVVVDFDPSHPDQLPPIPPVKLAALVADPGASRRLDWEMVACAPTDTERCDDPKAAYDNIGSGTIDDPDGPSLPDGTSPSGNIGGLLRLTPDVLKESIAVDPYAGFDSVAVQVELMVKPEGAPLSQAVYASKQVFYAARVPKDRVANRNPVLKALMVDDVAAPVGRCPDAGAPVITVAPEQEIHLVPVETADDRETYVLPTFDGGEKTFVENISYSWLATAGTFSREFTGGPKDAFGNDPPLDTKWRAPTADALGSIPDGKIPLWVVMRDERGGQSWSERCIHVVAP